MSITGTVHPARPFAHLAKGWSIGRIATALATLLLAGATHAQGVTGCSLGKINERVAAQYPLNLQGRIVEGTVSMIATFAPDGHVSASKALTGPAALQFESRAYLNGWRAEPSSDSRECLITFDYRFDGSRAVCDSRTPVTVRPQRIDESHVLMKLSCDTW
jgi:hypothetical protein